MVSAMANENDIERRIRRLREQAPKPSNGVVNSRRINWLISQRTPEEEIESSEPAGDGKLLWKKAAIALHGKGFRKKSGKLCSVVGGGWRNRIVQRVGSRTWGQTQAFPDSTTHGTLAEALHGA